MIKGLERLSHKKRELGLFSLEMKSLRGNFINVYRYLVGESREYGARPFQVVPSDR